VCVELLWECTKLVWSTNIGQWIQFAWACCSCSVADTAENRSIVFWWGLCVLCRYLYISPWLTWHTGLQKIPNNRRRQPDQKFPAPSYQSKYIHIYRRNIGLKTVEYYTLDTPNLLLSPSDWYLWNTFSLSFCLYMQTTHSYQNISTQTAVLRQEWVAIALWLCSLWWLTSGEW